MKKFKVTAVSRQFFEIEIEAEDENQAWQLANEADGGQFTAIQGDDGDWEIYDVKPTE